jgi:hypothetical protein
MISLGLTFKSVPYLLSFLLIASLAAYWISLRLEQDGHFSLRPFIVLNLLLLVAWGLLAGIDMDETEHLHCSWMVSCGMVPYRDFWQHHSPLLWVLLSPFFKLLKPSVAVFDLSRTFSALVFVFLGTIGWRICRRTWQERAVLPLYLSVLSAAAISGEFLWLRPDLFMMLFFAAGPFTAAWRCGQAAPAFAVRRHMLRPGRSFVLKQYLLLLLPVILVFIERKRALAKLCTYSAGLVLGLLPLAAYLIGPRHHRRFPLLGFLSSTASSW